jgi:anti-anti-sigma factor
LIEATEAGSRQTVLSNNVLSVGMPLRRGKIEGMAVSKPNPCSWLEVKQVGTAAVMKMPAGNLYHDEVIDLIGEELSHLIATSGCHRFVLDFGSVNHISSELLGVLLLAQKRVLDHGDRLTLCALNADLRGVFVTLRLDQVFTLAADEQEALGDAH